MRDVCEAVRQPGHGYDAVLNLLKATMPSELYGTLYGLDNLYAVITMLKYIYAKKPQPATTAAATAAAQGATAPFTLMHSPGKSTSKPQETNSLEEQINQLTETLYRMDMEGKPTKRPFKPFMTSPRRRFKQSFDRGQYGQRGCFDQRNNRGRFRGG